MNANVSKTNGVKLLAVVAVLAMVVCAFAAVMPAEETEAAAGDTQYYSGTLDKVQPFTSGTNVIIDKDLTIKSTTDSENKTNYGILAIDGATLTINAGVTVTVDKGGYLYFGKDNTTIVNNGTIIVKNEGKFYNNAADSAATTKVTEGITNNGVIEIQRGGVVDMGVIDYAKFTQGSDAPTVSTGTAGTIALTANGSIKSLSTKTTASIFNNQTVTMAVGSVVDLNSKINGVTVSAKSGTGIYTYGSMTINMPATVDSKNVVQTNPQEGNLVQEYTDIAFSVTSEKIADAYYGGKAYNRATAYVLDVSGSLGAYTNVIVNANNAEGLEGTNKLVMKDYGVDSASSVEIKGTVSVTDSFKVNANTTITVNAGAIVNVSGNVDVSGTAKSSDGKTSAAPATANIYGVINVSGQIAIDSVAKDGPAVLNLKESSNGAYINIIGEGVVSIEDYDLGDFKNAPMGTNGVTYINDGVFYITNLAKAVEGALADKGEDTISIWGYKAATGKVITTPYVIDTTYDIPADLTVYIEGYVVIADGVTLTVPEDADISSEYGAGELVVKGKLMDYTMAADAAGFTLTADVRTIDADETYYLYTSLKNALADANEGDTIELYGDEVVVDKNLTIQSGVTVDVGAGKTLKVLKNVTLTIDGVLDLSESTAALNLETAASPDKSGAVVLNNKIVVDDITGFTPEIPGFYVVGDIGETVNGNYIMAPAVAAANSASLSTVDVRGDVTYSGDLTFTAAEDETSDIEITISGAKVSISKIIIDGYYVEVAKDKQFTGTVEAAVTAGTSAVTLEKSGSATVKVETDESGETPVSTLVLAKTDGAKITGKITISAGSVELDATIGVGGTRATALTVAEGATLVVPEGVTLKIDASTEQGKDYSAIVIDGTLALDNADNFLAVDATSKPMTVNGTMTVVGDITIPKNFTVIVNGTLAVSEVEDEEGSLAVEGSLVVGTAPETIGVGGTVTGPVTIANNNYITVYAGASVETAKLNVNATSSESNAVATEFFINGALYKTVYAFGNVQFYDDSTNASVLPAAGTEIVGYNTANINNIAYWFTDADYKNKVDASATVGSEGNEALYFNAPAENAKIQFSVGSGISLFVDGVKVTSGNTGLYSVGTHTVTATVNPGYTGDVTITFNGQTVTGTFEVTPEMADQYNLNGDTTVVLSATGNIAVDSGASGASDGMGLTEILLIILVVLIVVMAIMVALRLMRS